MAEQARESFVLPTNETVTSGEYPLSRVLYLYVNKAPEEELQGVMKEFLTFLNTQPAQQVAAAAGVYPLTSGQAASNLAKLGQAPLSVSTLR